MLHKIKINFFYFQDFKFLKIAFKNNTTYMGVRTLKHLSNHLVKEELSVRNLQ